MKSTNAQNAVEKNFLSKDNPSSEILAQWLKRSLDKNFGSLVDENIARLSSTDITSKNASENIFKNISDSAEMFSFRSDLEHSIEIALSNIMEKDMYCNANQIPQYTLSEITKRSVSRMACLQSILKTPLSEVVSSPTWRKLQKVLCEELSHEDSNAFTLVLQIHTRLLTSASPVAIKEGFLNLLEGLSLHYLSHQIFPDLPNGSQGLKFSSHTHYRIVQISQTILTALCDAPKRWIRFGEKRFEEMIDNFVDMLTMHTYNHVPRKDSKHVFFPYHIISAIDPEAVWCKNLMHAAYGREITLNSFSKAPSLMRSIVEDVVSWLDQNIHETKDLLVMNDLDSKGIIHGNAIRFASFTHSLSVISLIVSFENGWKIFPIQTHLRDDPLTLQEIVILCLQFLNKAPDVEIPFKLSEILINAVVQIMVSKGSNILYSTNQDISQILLQPISSLRQFHIEPCTSTVKILCKIAELPHGFNWLLKRSENSRKARISTHSSVSSVNEGHVSSTQRNRKNSVRSVSPYTYSITIMQSVSDFATFVLKNEETFMSDLTYEKFTINVLLLCCKLFGQHDGLNVLDASKSKLLQYAVVAYQHTVHKVNNLVPTTGTDQFVLSHQDMQRTLLQFLLKVASTPVGFRHLTLHSGVIESLMQDEMNTSSPLDPMDLWTNTQFCRVLQFADSTLENSLSIRRKLLSKALNYVYSAFENEEAFMNGSDQLQNKAVNEFKMQLLIICSGVKVLQNLLEDHEDSSTDSTLVDGDPPNSLPQLINLALSECNALNCLPHWIGLLSLHILTLNMNFMLLLESRFSFQETLTNLQSKNIVDENDEPSSSPNRDLSNIVWDDCSSLRNQILKETFKVNEGSRTMSRISSALSSSPLSPQPLSWPGRRMQTELQRFLHDTRPGLHDNTWLGHAKRAYRLSAHADVKLTVLLDLADQVQRCQPLQERPSRTFIWPKSDSTEAFESELQDKLGAELSLRYGLEQRLIQNASQQTREQLLLLLHQSKSFLQITDQLPFDWFVSSVFLLSGGNIERSRSLLQRIAPLSSTAFLWANLASALCQEDLAATFGHQLETIVALHFPQAHHALQLAGISWWWLSDQLVEQGLLPILHIQQIAHAIVLCILHSCDFQLLLRVALLAHLQPRLLQAAAQSANIVIALQRSPQMDFRICDYLPLMDRLAKYCRFSTSRETL